MKPILIYYHAISNNIFLEDINILIVLIQI